MAAHTPATTAHTTAPNPYPGETLDSDGHVYIHPEVFRELFPELAFGAAFDFLDGYVKHPEFAERRARNRDELWQTKGLGALGAFDPDERVEALDRMGIRSQLMFANNTLHDLRAATQAARAACVRYNDYALEFTRRTKGRCRAVCHVNTTDVDFAIAEAKRVLAKGARAIDLPCNQPPGGVSPSHESWDPLWAALAEADVPAFLHIGNQGLLENDQPEDTMFPHPDWRRSAALMNKPAFRAGGEEAISPYYMLVVHMAPELYLQTMVMGKVFERHPRLRFGIVECGSTWLGPCVERMDTWCDFMTKVGVKYDLKPSEYVRRNVRIPPLWNEDLPRMIERYGLEEVYCFGSDYPHLEGSKDPFGKFQRHLDKLPRDYHRRFFIENNELLLPNG